MNDLKPVSIVISVQRVGQSVQCGHCDVRLEDVQCGHCDVVLEDVQERAQHEKTHFTVESHYCRTLLVSQSEMTRHLVLRHNSK